MVQDDLLYALEGDRNLCHRSISFIWLEDRLFGTGSMIEIFQTFGIYPSLKDLWSSSVRTGARESLHSFRVLPLPSSGPDALLELMFLKLRRTSSSLETYGRAGWSRTFSINCLCLLSAAVSFVEAGVENVQIVGLFAVIGCCLETCTLLSLVVRDGLCALPVQSRLTLLNIVFNFGGTLSFVSLDVSVFFFRYFLHCLNTFCCSRDMVSSSLVTRRVEFW